MVRMSGETTPRADNGARAEARNAIEKNAALDASYFVMNGLSAVVACYGLFANSAAGVIGAMIIATLLGPIMGIALALVDGNNRLLRASLTAEVSGSALVLAMSFGVGWIHTEIPLTPEILARTSPNVLDLMIALAGGAAGAYATVSPKVSVGLVGVAIATALVPPLATSGLCLARGEGGLAWGGFLLFLTNLVAIQLASSVVMWLHGFHELVPKPSMGWLLLRRNMPSIVLLLVLGFTLGLNFKTVLAAQTYKNEVRTSLTRSLSVFPGVRLSDLWIEERDVRVVVVAVVLTPFSFTPERVAQIERQLPSPDSKVLELHVRAVLTKEATAREYMHELPAEQTPVEPRQPSYP